MATRSTIAIEREDGTVVQVYCHWDGYLSNNGRLLQEYYNTADNIEALIAQGSISSLRPEIGVKHDFSRLDSDMGEDEYEAQYGNMTTFYARDRGEEVRIEEFKDFQDYVVNAQFEEYDYIFRKGKWYVQQHGSAWQNLALAIEAEQVLDDM